MASFTAFLEVSGKQYPLQRYELGMRQEIDHLGRPASPVLGVVITCTLHSPVSSDSFLYQWMLSPTMQQDGKIRLLQAGVKATEKTISFFNAYCVDMNLNFFPGLSGGLGSSWLQVQISPQRVAVGAIVHDNNWPLDSHGAGETFSLAAYQANNVPAPKAPKPPRPAICAQIADATDMRKSKKERYAARLAVIDATSDKLKETDLSPAAMVMPADATRVAGGKPNGKSTPSFSEALAANRRFELNNRAIERAKLTNAIYLMDKKKFYESLTPPQPEKFKEMLAAQAWPTEKNGLPEGWGMIERSEKGTEPVYAVYQSTFERDAKPVLVFRGTDNAVNAKDDWITNLMQGNGMDTKQYRGSIEKARELKKRYGADGFEIAGHSKAGGQAAATGIITGAKAYTFNAAGVHPRTVGRSGNYSLADARRSRADGRPVVDAFNFPYDILNNIQDTAMPVVKGGLIAAPSMWGKALGAGLTLNNTMPTAAGVRHIVPAQDILGNKISSPWNPLTRVDYHGMPYLINSMEKQKKDDLKTLAAYMDCQ